MSSAVTGQPEQVAEQVVPINSQLTDPAGDTGPRGRQSAIAMLDAVCAYLEAAEPANPAPLLIRRARNMIGKDFVSILKEIAPDGLHQVEMVAGISAQE